jgi:hypothetical protein
MAALFLSLRWAHVAAGGIALMLFWVPVIAPKGGKAHVRAGWLYVLGMSVVAVTAFVMSALAFSVPLAIRQFTQPLFAADISDFVRVQRVFATFLAYLAGVTLALGWQGIWAVETRSVTKNMNVAFGLVLNLAIVLGGLVVLVLGIKSRSGPLIGLSPLGPLLGARNLRYLRSGPRSPMHWWYMHLASMIGTGIAGYTAFLVFGGSRLFPALARNQIYTVFWILPILIGVPVIRLMVEHYRRKFHETDPALNGRIPSLR